MSGQSIDVSPVAIGVGEWSVIGTEGVDHGVLVRLFLPSGLNAQVDGEVTLNLNLGLMAAAQLADELNAAPVHALVDQLGDALELLTATWGDERTRDRLIDTEFVRAALTQLAVWRAGRRDAPSR